MNREVLLWCLPYAAMLVAAVVALRLLALLSGVRIRPRRLLALHSDQRGGVQSVSFVLTLPAFVMIVMFIVQLSQLMIARVVVEYAVFAAARSAIVWIPANIGPLTNEQENQISQLTYAGDYVNNVPGGDGQTYSVYEVAPEGPKFSKVQLAAAMACMSISPSRATRTTLSAAGNTALPSIVRAYLAAAPSEAANPRVPVRLKNKLAYALDKTTVQIEIHHKQEEPPLAVWVRYPDEFAVNEIGWQDQVYVTVQHDFALLPGPGRLLARQPDVYKVSVRPPQRKTVRRRHNARGRSHYRKRGHPPHPHHKSNSGQGSNRTSSPPSPPPPPPVYTFTLTATVRLGNEGEQSSLPFVQTLDGRSVVGYSAPTIDINKKPNPIVVLVPCRDCTDEQLRTMSELGPQPIGN